MDVRRILKRIEEAEEPSEVHIFPEGRRSICAPLVDIVVELDC